MPCFSQCQYPACIIDGKCSLHEIRVLAIVPEFDRPPTIVAGINEEEPTCALT